MPTTSGVARHESPLPVLDSTNVERAQSPVKTQKPQTGDSLSSSNNKTSHAGCFTKLWNAICNFFKCICPCLFGRKTQENSSQSTKTSENISSNNRQTAQTCNNKTTPEPSPVEKAQTQLVEWWSQLDGVWGYVNRAGDIDPTLLANLQLATKTDCPQEKIVLFQQEIAFADPNSSHRSKIKFYYARISGKDEYFPIDWDVGALLRDAKRKNIVLPWTITHPQTKKQIVVQVEEFLGIEASNEITGTRDSLLGLITDAASNRQSKAFSILEALVPHAQWIKKIIDETEYAQLTILIPAYKDACKDVSKTSS